MSESERRGGGVLVVGTPLLRDALATLLERRGHLEVVTPGPDEQAAALARAAGPEIVVLELTADAGRLSLLRELVRVRPAPRVVLIGNHAAAEHIQAAIDAGAGACVAPEEGYEELMRAVAAVRENRRHLGPVIRDLLARPRPTPPGLLTMRERQVLAMIAEGNTDREIAARLELSPRTIHTYRTSVMSKLRVHNVIALVRRALELGLVSALLVALSP